MGVTQWIVLGWQSAAQLDWHPNSTSDNSNSAAQNHFFVSFYTNMLWISELQKKSCLY